MEEEEYEITIVIPKDASKTGVYEVERTIKNNNDSIEHKDIIQMLLWSKEDMESDSKIIEKFRSSQEQEELKEKNQANHKSRKFASLLSLLSI